MPTADPTTGGGGTAAPYSPTVQHYFDSLLIGLGVKGLSSAQRTADLQALEAVAQLETGPNNTMARYNPLNAVVGEAGSSNFNSAGVQNYASFDTGVLGGIDLLNGSRWASVKADLLAGATAQKTDADIAAVYATWGSHVTFPTDSVTDTTANRLTGPAGGTAPTDAEINSWLAAGGGSTQPGGSTGVNTTFDPFGVSSVLDLAEQAWSDLFSGSFWLRIGLVLFGFFFILVAIDKLSDGALSGSMSSNGAPSAMPTGDGDGEPEVIVEPIASAVTPATSGKHESGGSPMIGKHRPTIPPAVAAAAG